MLGGMLGGTSCRRKKGCSPAFIAACSCTCSASPQAELVVPHACVRAHYRCQCICLKVETRQM